MGLIKRFFHCKTCETSWSSKEYRKLKSQCPNKNCDNDEYVKDIRKKRKYYGRLFGHFSCKKCANRWASAFAYHRVWQKCKECFAKATPHNLIEHEIKEDNKNDPEKKRKPHRADLCGMCSTGTPCQAVRDQQLPDVIQALQRVTLVEPAR